MDSLAAKMIEERSEPRDEVYARVRATLADRRTIPLTVVNLSPHGLMARTEATIAVGEWIKVELPGIGAVSAAVRWSLGGRIGCQLDRAIADKPYRTLLTALGG